MGLALAVGTLTGPWVGALFIEFVTWRWIGWINLPFCAVAFILAWVFLRLKTIDLALGSKIRRLDILGMILFASGTTLFALSLSWAGALFPWTSWQTLVPLIMGLFVLTIFAIYEARPVEPRIPHRMFSNRTFGAALASGLLNWMLTYSLVLYISLFFQAAFLQPPLQAAITGISLACVTFGFSFLAPIMMQYTRLCSLVGRDTSMAMNHAFQVFRGVGIGTVFSTTTMQLQARVELVDDMGLGAGLLVMSHLFGALIGQAIGSAVSSASLQRAKTDLGPLPEPLRVLESPYEAIEFIPTLGALEYPDEVRAKLVDAYQSPFQRMWVVMT
ncbi:efflux pump antibiotic resistance protein [Apiospora marii]|uniref:efflux pump antibiotic resistance protein n=1 Tax=Apiospora marii TaxID=335849 RepID=UPI00312D88BA